MSAWLLGVTAVLVGCSTRSDRGEDWSQQVPGGSSAVAASEEETDASESSTVPSASGGDGSSALASETPTDDSTAHERDVEAEPEVHARAEATIDPDAAIDPPEPEPEAEPASLVSLPDANISIQGVEADGQRLDVLQCQATNLPLFGSMVLVASIAEHKRALDRCAPSGAAVALRWRFEGGKPRDFTVEHASSARVGACVTKAMKKVTAPFSAECGAVVLVGDRAGADAALAELRTSVGR